MDREKNDYLLGSYLYDLPQEKIAPFPQGSRASSKLLLLNRDSGGLKDSRFKNISDFLREGDLLVLNNSSVIKARLLARKRSGGKVEILLVRPLEIEDEYRLDTAKWEALIHPARAIRDGTLLDLPDMEVSVLGRNKDGHFDVEFVSKSGRVDILDYLQKNGEVPLPPYIKKRRKQLSDELPDLKDEERYQNVYADPKGSVAAPTAGFHFDEDLMSKLRAGGISFTFVTLHVGPGTFKPVTATDIRDHRMEREWFRISDNSIKMINEAKKSGRRVIAVGTTSIRVLETVFMNSKPLRSGFTELYIKPGFDFKIVDAIITNFHIPGSTLLLLVSAFAGRDKILNAYKHAVENDYRFYSYGDAMFIY